MFTETFTVTTDVPAAHIQQRLKAQSRSWLKPHTALASRQRRPVTGQVSGDRFVLRAYRMAPYALRPVMSGSLRATETKTTLSVSISIPAAPLVVRVFVMGLAAVVATWLATRVPDPGVPVFASLSDFLLFSLGLLPFVALITWVQLRQAAADRTFLRAFLLRVTDTNEAATA
jgi:hypothetical protein